MTRATTGRATAARPRIVPRGSPAQRGVLEAADKQPLAQPARPRRKSPPPREQQGRQPASPIKEATWKWYIPIYFWLGGIASGSWLAATAEDLVGENDRDVVRAGRYLAASTLLGGTALLILDLGRPDRFQNMLRVVRARSAMSLGSWGLTTFGAITGGGAVLQAAEDGLLGAHPSWASHSRGGLGRAVHVAGLPAALFVGSYTGVLLASTSTASWARRVRILGPLFLASGVSSGLAAVTGVVECTGDPDAGVRKRLARAESVALATELALATMSARRARSLPSARDESVWSRLMRGLVFGAGMVAPLTTQVRRSRSSVFGVALTLAGSLGLRFLVTREGRRSARTPDDTWALTRMPGRTHVVTRGRGEQLATTVRRPPRSRRRATRGEITGWVTVVQEDRIRVVSERGRGYLFTVRKRRARASDLARWRDARTLVRVRYRGVPDAGAMAEAIQPA